MEPNKNRAGMQNLQSKQRQTHIKKQQKKNTAPVAPVIFLAIFAIILGVAAGLLLRQVFETRLQAEHALNIKSQFVEDLSERLNYLEVEYDELSTQNEHLEGQLRQERARISRLRSELRGIDPAKAQEYQEKISNLEKQLESYREQVAMLETEKQSLEGEKSQMQSTLNQTTARFDELERKKKELEEKVEKAAYLTISGITAQAIRERRRGDEPTDRARRTDKIQVCFTVNENHVAEPGSRDFHIRIIDPNNQVLADSRANVFEHNGEELVYTNRRVVNFRNEQQNVCIVWSQPERFDSGYYNVNIYAEGREAGYKLFELH